METIASRLLAFREGTGLNKRAFAEKTGLDPGLYGRYESGVNKPSYETLEKIVNVFPKLNLNWLLTGKGIMILESTASKWSEGGTEVERIRELERELAREKAWTEKLWEENQGFRSQLGKKLSSSDAATDERRSIMWVEKAA